MSEGRGFANRGGYDPSDEDAMSHDEAIAYLERDPGAVPSSRYGYDSSSCAPFAVAVAVIVADANGEPITRDGLEHAMSLVVNDHDDVRTLIEEHGNEEQRAMLALE